MMYFTDWRVLLELVYGFKAMRDIGAGFEASCSVLGMIAARAGASAKDRGINCEGCMLMARMLKSTEVRGMEAAWYSTYYTSRAGEELASRGILGQVMWCHKLLDVNMIA